MAQVSITGFTATLAAPLMAEDTTLVLNAAAQTLLVSRLSDAGNGNYAFLYVHDGASVEVVKVSAYAGTLALARASTPHSFPKGACVDGRVTYDGVKDLICNFDCCAGDCPCEAVAAAGMVIPASLAGVPWEGMVVFSGAMPMALSVQGAPAWLGVTLGANFVKLAGTPPFAGHYLLSVGATNCNGAVASQPVMLDVQG
ncbi:hypothetical protein P3T23_004513 [Paraburkholderia sp. GAS448]|uniref:hypothetical protein n=1 Tax=Paraburkholderia sp. GAS448 TaxID=3035136 RepID=UPI003D19D795